MKKIKNLILLTVSLLSLTVSLLGNSVTNTRAADMTTWLICKGPWGEWKEVMIELNQVRTTEKLPYLVASKPSIAKSEGKVNIFNSILEMSGYKFGAENKASVNSPFDTFGFRGISFSSYIGEWKYYPVDGCKVAKEQTTSTDYGEYYNGRLDPLTTYSERRASKDPRVEQLINNKYYLSFRNTMANVFLFINKLIVTIGLSLIGLSFTDVAEAIGITETATTNIFTSLYNNFFIPLQVLMIVLTGIYIMYKGIIKREYRTAVVGGLLKPILTLFVVTLFLMNKNTVTWPNKITTLGQTLVMQTLGHTVTSKGSDDFCASTVGMENITNPEDLLSGAGASMRSMLGCRVWKEFVFKPWVKGQWNTDYRNLYSLDNINSAWVGQPTVTLGGNSVTNWALFQQSIQSGYHTPVDNEWSGHINGVDKDWFRIVDALSNYDEVVIRYGSNGGSSGNTPGGTSSSRGNLSDKLPDTPASHWSDGDPYTHNLFTKRDGITAEQLDGFLQSTGIPYDSNRINGKLLLEWQEASGVDVRAIIAIAIWESSLGTAGVATIPGSNMFGYAAFDSNPENASNFNDGTAIVRMAEETLVGNKNQTFKRQDDKAAAYHNGTLNVATDGGVYFTANNGHGKKRAITMAQIDAYIDAHGGASDKADNTATGTGIRGNSRGDSSSSSIRSDGGSEGGYKVVKQVDSLPLEEWKYWTGNVQGGRFTETLIGLLFTIIGLAAPIVLSAVAAALGIGITLLTMVAPIFLLFGLWGGKGNEVMLNYLGLLLSTMYKKVIASFLVVISVMFTSNIMDLINTIGMFKSLVYMLVVTLIIINKKEEILNTLGKVNIGSMNLSGFMKGVRSLGTGTKKVAQGTLSFAVGYKGARDLGASSEEAFRAGSSGAASFIRNQLATKEFGRKANAIYERNRKGRHSGPHSHPYCVGTCGGREIQEGETYYMDDYGNYYCQECQSDIESQGITLTMVGKLDNSNTDEEFILEKTYIKESDTGIDVQVSQPTYEDMYRKVGVGNERLSGNIDKNALYNIVTNSLDKTKEDIKRMKEFSTKKNKLGQFARFNDFDIPAFLQISKSELEILRNNPTQEQIDNYIKIVEEAWIDYFKANISQDNKDVKEFIDITKMRTEEVYDER